MFKKYVFWQNILSIHQSAFIRNLAENNYVTVVVEKKFNEERIKQGWTIPDFGKALLIISPEVESINSLLSDKEIIHVFTGIKSFKLASQVFILATKQKAKVGVILEPFNWIGIKGKLRFIKYLLLRLKFGKNIDFLLVIGNRGRWCYEKTGFHSAKIYDWGYFTESNKLISKESTTISLDRKPNIIFVGSIDNNKNILELVSVCKKNRDIFQNFLIIGSGPLKQELLFLIKDSNFSYLGNISNENVKEHILDSDLLILPSKYDGWGAVVNEALTMGTPVLVSENCGSSILIDGDYRGTVFSIDKNNLEEILISFLQKLPYGESKRNSIINWADKSISGKIAAEYFLQIVGNVYYISEKPIAPWLIKNN